jgi:hypothetical protein
MNLLPKIITLKHEAQKEIYEFFDKEVRVLKKKSDDSIDEYALGLVDNDVDAMRHAYVSGVYVMEFSEQTSELLGRLNEFIDLNSESINKQSENMDLWNNSVGRKYGKKAKSKKELFELLLKALKNGELIIDPGDTRKYNGEKLIKRLPKYFVIKIKENKTGANLEFFDFHKRIVMTKDEFLTAIKSGKYPGYAIKKHFLGEYPYSTRDKFSFNNLG